MGRHRMREKDPCCGRSNEKGRETNFRRMLSLSLVVLIGMRGSAAQHCHG